MILDNKMKKIIFASFLIVTFAGISNVAIEIFPPIKPADAIGQDLLGLKCFGVANFCDNKVDNSVDNGVTSITNNFTNICGNAAATGDLNATIYNNTCYNTYSDSPGLPSTLGLP